MAIKFLAVFLTIVTLVAPILCNELTLDLILNALEQNKDVNNLQKCQKIGQSLLLAVKNPESLDDLDLNSPDALEEEIQLVKKAKKILSKNGRLSLELLFEGCLLQMKMRRGSAFSAAPAPTVAVKNIKDPQDVETHTATFTLLPNGLTSEQEIVKKHSSSEESPDGERTTRTKKTTKSYSKSSKSFSTQLD